MDLAGVGPRVSVNTKELQDLLVMIEGKIDLRKGLGAKIAKVLREDALRQFQAGGIPAWAPLSPRTIERKRRLGYPRLNRRGLIPRAMLQNGRFGPENILMMKGDLLSSWTNENDPHNVTEIDEFSIENGSDLIYAGTMQEGGQGFGGSQIPARPIRITDEATAKIVDLIETAVSGE